MKTTFRVLGLAAAIAGGLSLSACDSSDSGGSKPTTTGVLTDAPIQGVSYVSRPSGLTGVTEAGGYYQYKPGDNTTFRLGSLDLGTVPATGVITPIDLAGAGNDNRLTNLLVLLQTLDSDGNPDNGITIEGDVAGAVNTGIDLDADPADFANGTVNTALATILSDFDYVHGIRTPEDAEAHFLEQGLVLLSQRVWVIYSRTEAIMLRMADDGEYLLGEATPDDYTGVDCGETPDSCVEVQDPELVSRAGVEYGVAAILGADSYGYIVEGTAGVDTNLQGGLSDRVLCDRLKPEGDSLTFGGACPDDGDQGEILAAPNDNASLVGVWALDTTDINTQHLMFLPNGRFLLVDPIGDQEEDSCGGPGVEYAAYSVNGAGRLALGTVYYDTNGCAGLITDGALNADSFTFTLSENGRQLTLNIVEDGGAFQEGRTLYRVSAPPLL